MKLLIKEDPDTRDIINAMLAEHERCKPMYDVIAKSFYCGNAMAIAIFLFSFCKKHIQYVIEPASDQTVRTPVAILGIGNGDSKHYAMFIAGILDSLRRQGITDDITSIKYRFVSEKSGYVVHHVFIVLNDQFCVDPVLKKFSEGRKWAVMKDFEIKK